LSDNDSATILIVDDEADIRRLMTMGLQRRGYRTVEAADGEAALRVLEDGEIDVDLVLLDGALPKLSGLEVLVRLRSTPHLATLPVIMVTGKSGLNDRVNGLTAGADDFVAKPVALDELVARIEANLRGHRVWVELMTRRLRERSQLAALLATNLSSFDRVVQHVVDSVGGVPSVATAALVDLSLHGRATLLHHSAPSRALGVATGAGLDPVLTLELTRLSTPGAALLNRSFGVGLFGPDSGPVVAATVGEGATGTGVLLIEVDASAADQRAAAREMLGLAVELAPMIENMLASARGDEPSAQLTQELLHVIEAQEFWPAFQPICNIDTGAMVGYEALTRFDDGTPPETRFAKASLLGLGPALELATLRVAFRAAEALPADRYLSVNVSAPLLGHAELPAILDLAAGRRICVELTEHEQIDDYERTIADFRQLGRNLRLSVDDAGSGWASLRHVFTLRPDYVKLDRGWVADIHTDPARQALLLGIARFVAELGGQVIAEGVERHTELATLRSLGIHFAQGYLLGHPASVQELVAS